MVTGWWGGNGSPAPPSHRWSVGKPQPYNSANMRPDTRLYYVDVKDGSFLKGLSVDRKVKTAKERGSQVQAVKQILRWGRANIVTDTDTYFALEFLTTEPPA